MLFSFAVVLHHRHTFFGASELKEFNIVSTRLLWISHIHGNTWAMSRLPNWWYFEHFINFIAIATELNYTRIHYTSICHVSKSISDVWFPLITCGTGFLPRQEDFFVLLIQDILDKQPAGWWRILIKLSNDVISLKSHFRRYFNIFYV